MKIELRQRDRRALVFLGLAVGLYAASQFVIFPAYDRLSASSEEVSEKEEQLRKYRRALLRKGQYERLIPAAGAQVREAEKILVRGDNPALATTELQTLVEAAARNAGINVLQRSVAAPRKVDAFYGEVVLSLSFEATLTQLVNLLVNLRSAPKLLDIRSVQISPAQPLPEMPKAAGDYRKTLRVTMTIGAVLGSTAPPSLPGGAG